MEKIDARGMSCPEPVLITQRELKKHTGGIEIQLDTNVSVENVTRYAKSQGYNVSVAENKGEFTLKIKK